MTVASQPPSTLAGNTATSSLHSSVATVEQIRDHFPALYRKHSGQPVAYFDGPGGTQVPREVVGAVTAYLVNHNANTHWNYPTSAETDEILANARAALADFLGGQPSEIVFGANATTLAFHVSRTLGRTFSPQDELIVTELDHHANVGPWQALAAERGCTLHVVRMNTETGDLDWADFERKVNKRTKLVAVGAASNALGTIIDVGRAAKLAHSVGAYLIVDAVHYAPHHLVDVRAMDCDFLIASAYKFYGPHVGVLWCRRELLESLPFPKLIPAPDRAPERAETGTLNHEGIAGAAAAVDFLASLAQISELSPLGRGQGEGALDRRLRLRAAYSAIHERGAALTHQLSNGLSDIKGVTVYGPPPTAPRTSTIAFTVSRVPSSEVARRLADRALFLSHGNFYAHTVISCLNLAPEGLVRAGCACYTTCPEVERLLLGVSEIAPQGS
jgi:cysteine desulfurase family protein (TIGR01976 family)